VTAITFFIKPVLFLYSCIPYRGSTSEADTIRKVYGNKCIYRSLCTLRQVVKTRYLKKNEDCVFIKKQDYRSISQQVKTPKTAENDRIRGFFILLGYRNEGYRTLYSCLILTLCL
jgi:hypothetical protein